MSFTGKFQYDNHTLRDYVRPLVGGLGWELETDNFLTHMDLEGVHMDSDTVNFYGMHAGRLGGNAVYSPWEGIENDLGALSIY